MSFASIRYSVMDGIATITFNRPQVLNAFTPEMAAELVAAMDLVDSDDDVRAVVFTGEGRAFSGGADLSGGDPRTSAASRNAAPVTDDTFDMSRDADYGGTVARRFYESTKPLIAAINGPAVGIGATCTLPMDIRLASVNARFGFVFTRRGLVPEACSSFFLPRLVGIGRAAEWVYSGRLFDAQEALAAGLVRSLHEPDDLLPAAYSLAGRLTEFSSPVAVALSRRMMWQMLASGTPELAHDLDSRALHYLSRRADFAEGVQAFLDKREPVFTLRVSNDLPKDL